MPRPSKIDTLPAKDRRAVIRALTQALTEQTEPNYRALCASLAEQVPSFGQAGISHVTLFRFAQKHVKPGITRTAQEIAARQTEVTRAKEQQLDAVVSETERSLTDDPIRSLLLAQQNRLHRNIEAAESAGMIDQYAKLESVAGQNYERFAKAIQHPGFSSAAAPTTVNQVVLVLPRPGDVQRRRELAAEVIEAEVVDPQARHPA